MKKPKGLIISKTGKFRFRKRVPKDLKDIYRRREIKLPINTTCYKRACEEAMLLGAHYLKEIREYRERIEAKKQNPDMLSQYSENKLKGLANNWLKRKLDDSEIERADNIQGSISVSETIMQLEMDLQDIHQEIIGVERDKEHRGMTQAIKYLNYKQISYEAGTQIVRRLAYYFSEAIKELIQSELDFYNGRKRKLAHIYHNPALPQMNTIRLSALIERYMADPSVTRTPSTVKNYTIVFRIMEEMFGPDKYVHEIRIEDCERVRDTLRQYPSNAAKRAPNKSVKETIALAEKKDWPLLSDTTINGYLNKFSALMNYAAKRDYIVKNPAMGLRVAEKLKKTDRRQSFSKEQLEKIFLSPEYKRFEGHHFFAPLIALYTGMRMNEILQLDIEDFQEEDGIWFINIEDGGDDTHLKKLKTASSRRKVPVHPALIETGLIDFMTLQKRKKERKVFPKIQRNNLGYHATYSKAFTRYLKKIGAKTDRTSFHSFRHTFRDALREAGIPRDAVQALGGWASEGTFDDYGSGLKLQTLHKHISKIHYEGLNLKQIKKHQYRKTTINY